MYFTGENKKTKTFILQCDAYDFETVQFDITDFGEHDDFGVGISTLNSDFYSKQDYSFLRRLVHKLRLCLSILCGKEYRLFGVYVSKSDLKEFRKFINENIPE